MNDATGPTFQSCVSLKCAFWAACAAVIMAVFAAAASLAGAASGQERVGQNAHQHETGTRSVRPPLVTAYGREGDPRKVNRVIKIEMSDAMRYFPDQVRVKKGATVRFVVRNGGELPHEMVLGTMDDLKMHAALMKRNAETSQGEANVAHVDPGETGRLIWQFTRAGEFYYGCLVPGHFDAGMIGTVVVR